MKKNNVNFTKKRVSITILIEYLSFVAFFAFTSILYPFMVKAAPKKFFDPTLLNSMSSLELQLARDELVSFFISYIIIISILLIGVLIIYNVSRKLIWEYLMKKKFDFKKLWKYTIFNTTITLIFFLAVIIIYYIGVLISHSLSYLLSFIPEIIQMIFLKLIPFIILFYILLLLVQISNYKFVKNNYEFKKTLLELKNIKVKKYFKNLLYIFLSLYLANFVLYLFPKNIIFYILGILIYSAHNAIIKMFVVAKED